MASQKSIGDGHAEKWTLRILAKAGGNKDRQEHLTTPRSRHPAAKDMEPPTEVRVGAGCPGVEQDEEPHAGLLSRNEYDGSGLGPSSDH